ncbi:MAG: GIY-YIG nuclease family protein [Acidobacteriota bacterium]|nr:GIY-YIG nuclease family protein [Acidobacteriota bacterium]
MADWSVYLIRCRDGALYTGIATDVARRFNEHREARGRGSRFLRGRGPLRLVFERAVGPKGLAMRVERRVKNLRKRTKERLLDQGGLIDEIISRAKKEA